MNQENEQEREVLRHYIAGYRVARLRLDRLKARHDALKEDMAAPLKGTKYDSMPTSGGVSDGAASIIYRIADIEDRIKEQCKLMSVQCMRVMDMLEYLDDDSQQRLVLELRYIDGMNWYDISENLCISRSSCHRAERQALDALLGFDRVREIIGINCGGDSNDKRRADGKGA